MTLSRIAPDARHDNDDATLAGLHAARQLVGHLWRTACWEGDRCWWVQPQQRVSPTAPFEYAPMGSCLYDGTAGVALFLAEFARVTEDSAAWELARGAVRHAAWAVCSARSDGTLRRAPLGFYSGDLGVAYACAVVGTRTNDAELIALARQCTASPTDRLVRSAHFDLISGLAGAVVGFQLLATLLEEPIYQQAAKKCGKELLARAVRTASGWSWTHAHAAELRHLTGLSHGASGVAYALFTLARSTGDHDFLFAADRAFLYERHCFHASSGQWPDYRHAELHDLLGQADLEALRRRRVHGDQFLQKPAYPVAWCHGPPGIAFVRVAVSQSDVERRGALALEATTALRVVERRLHDTDDSMSLCHGRAGNLSSIAFALQQGYLLRDPAQYTRSVASLAQRLSTLTGELSCSLSTPREGIDCHSVSLMNGLSGAAYFFLTLADTATPSVLLPAPSGSVTLSRAHVDYIAARQQEIAYQFPETTRVVGISRLWTLGDCGMRESSPDDDLSAVRRHLTTLCTSSCDDPAALNLAIRLDGKRHDDDCLARANSLETVDRLLGRRFPVNDRDWVVLSESAELVADDGTTYSVSLGNRTDAIGSGALYLFYRQRGRVEVQRLTTIGAAVASALRSPRAYRDVVDSVSQALSRSTGHPIANTELAVQQQIEHMLRNGLIHTSADGLAGMQKLRGIE